MPRTGKKDERSEQILRGNRKTIKARPIRPQTFSERSVQNEEQLSDILHNFRDLIWEVDENGIFIWCTGAAEDIFGISTKELIGKKLFDFMPAEEAQRMKNIFGKISLRKQPIKDVETFHEDKQGKRHWLYINGVSIIDNKGLLKGYLGIYRDITSPKKNEEALRESVEELKNETHK
jgi:PAS domain S-box-containing protein